MPVIFARNKTELLLTDTTSLPPVLIVGGNALSRRLIKVKTSFHLIQVHRLPINCFHGAGLGSQEKEQPKEKEESKKHKSCV